MPLRQPLWYSALICQLLLVFPKGMAVCFHWKISLMASVLDGYPSSHHVSPHWNPDAETQAAIVSHLSSSPTRL